jgi:hypothetical protein
VLPLVRVTVLAAAALSTGGPPATPTPVPAATPSCIHALGAPAVYRPGTCPDPGSVPHGEPTWCTVPVVAGGLAACDPARAPHYVTVPAGR